MRCGRTSTAMSPPRTCAATSTTCSGCSNRIGSQATRRRFVRTDGDQVQLVADRLRVDAWISRSTSTTPRGQNNRARPHAVAAYEAALGRWAGEYLAGIDAPWALTERERLRARFLAAASRYGELVLGRGDFDRALAIVARALDAEPWAEPAHRLAIAAHLARGDRALARRAAQRCRQALAELGVDAEDSTRILLRTAG